MSANAYERRRAASLPNPAGSARVEALTPQDREDDAKIKKVWDEAAKHQRESNALWRWMQCTAMGFEHWAPLLRKHAKGDGAREGSRRCLQRMRVGLDALQAALRREFLDALAAHGLPRGREVRQ